METHFVTTEDGYILEVHRIPHSTKDNLNYRTPVIISHGMFGNALDWLRYRKKDSLREFSFYPRIMEKSCKFNVIIFILIISLAFKLSDAGYDVWLPNLRGAGNSDKHVEFPRDSEDYWDFRLKIFIQYSLIIKLFRQTLAMS